MSIITDPDLLKRLEGQTAAPTTADSNIVTDPALLAKLGGEVVSPQKTTAEPVAPQAVTSVAAPQTKPGIFTASPQSVMGIATPRQRTEAAAIREVVTGKPVAKRGKYTTPELRNTQPMTAFEQGVDSIRNALSPYTGEAMDPAEIAAAQISLESARQTVPSKTVEVNGQQVVLPARAMTRNEYVDKVNPDESGVRTLERFISGVPQGVKDVATGVLGAAQAMGSDTAKSAANALQADTLNAPIDDSFAGELGSGFGSLLTFLIPSMGVQKAASLISAISPTAARLAATGTMTAFEAATEGGSVYRDMLAKGYSDSDASAAAAKTFIANLPVNFVTDKAAFFPESGGNMVTRAINAGSKEGPQEGWQSYVSQRTQPGKVSTDDIIKSSAIGAITGAGTGAAQHQIEKNAPQQIPDFTAGVDFIPPTLPPGTDPSRVARIQSIMDGETPATAAERLAARQQPAPVQTEPDQPVNWDEYGVQFDEQGNPVEPTEPAAEGQPVTDPDILARLEPATPTAENLDYTSNDVAVDPNRLNFEIGLIKNKKTSKTAVLLPPATTPEEARQIASNAKMKAVRVGQELYIYDPAQISESSVRRQAKTGNGVMLGYGAATVPENGVPYAIDLDGHGTLDAAEIIELRDAGRLGFSGVAPDMAHAVAKIREMGRDDANVRGVAPEPGIVTPAPTLESQPETNLESRASEAEPVAAPQPTPSGIPQVSREDAIAAKQQVVSELATVDPESTRAMQLQIQLDQYNQIIGGEADYQDFQAPAMGAPQNIGNDISSGDLSEFDGMSSDDIRDIMDQFTDDVGGWDAYLPIRDAAISYVVGRQRGENPRMPQDPNVRREIALQAALNQAVKKEAGDFAREMRERTANISPKAGDALSAIGIEDENSGVVMYGQFQRWDTSVQHNLASIYNALRGDGYGQVRLLWGGTANSPNLRYEELEHMDSTHKGADPAAWRQTETIYNIVADAIGKPKVTLPPVDRSTVDKEDKLAITDTISSIAPSPMASKAKNLGKPAQKVDRQKDDIIVAVSKLGGIDTAQATREWGSLVKDGAKDLAKHVLQQTRRFGHVFKKTGLPIDQMRETLVGHGYLPEGASINDLLDAIDNHTRGRVTVSAERDLDSEAERMAREYEDRLIEAIDDDVLNKINFDEFTDDEANAFYLIVQAEIDDVVSRVYNENATPSLEDFAANYMEAQDAFWREYDADEQGSERGAGEVEPVVKAEGDSRGEEGNQAGSTEGGSGEIVPSVDDFERMLDDAAGPAVETVDKSGWKQDVAVSGDNKAPTIGGVQKQGGKRASTSDLMDAFTPEPAGLFEQKQPATKPATMQDHIAKAVDAGADAINEIFKGITDPNKLSSGPTFDDETYQKVRPHLKSMWDEIRAAGFSFKEAAQSFAKQLIDKFGAKIKPYALKFYGELADAERNGTILDGGETDGQRNDLERNSQDPETQYALGQEDIQPRPGGADSESLQRVQDTSQEGFEPDVDSVLPRRETAAPGERSDKPVRGRKERSGTEAVSAGSDERQRSGDTGDTGVPIESVSAEAVAKAVEQPVSVKAAKGSIDAELPQLHPGQREDVVFAEARFSQPDGYGVMFTNGTGTGKTALGLGIARRFFNKGKKNILIVAPNQDIIAAWIGLGKNLNLLDIKKLTDTKDNGGSGAVITTYANLGQNSSLARREWDLIITDEADNLSSNKDGNPSLASNTLKALSLHPGGAYQRAEMLNPDLAERRSKAYAKLNEARKLKLPTETLENKANAIDKEWQAVVDKTRAEVQAAQGENRTRVAFLSATPFAYEKSIDYAEGYLFSYGPEVDSLRYNSGSAYDRFMMQHFGYRMRYNKLTEPPPEVDRGIMQRQFNTWLKRQGVLSGRVLDVDSDYDRKFVLVDSGVGNKIDEGLTYLRENRRMRPVEAAVQAKFDHLSRRYLLEAIKAEAVIPLIKEHMARGRQVVVFHDFNKGGGFNPFEVSGLLSSEAEFSYTPEGADKPVTVKTGDVVREFITARPDLAKLDLGRLPAPLIALKKAFPDILVINGTETAKNRKAAIEAFQDDNDPRKLIIVQSDAGKAGISLHDTTGKAQRVTFNLGLPTKPVTSIQQEGRTYRIGQASNAMFRYLNTGTNWERYAFATTIANRTSAAENLALGESARALRDAFIEGFEESDRYPAGFEGEGTGGKERDRLANAALTEWDRATAMYFSQKKGRQNDLGADYFATPEPLGLKMVEWAGIRPGDSVLEPSGGHGAIARWFPEDAKRRMIEPSLELASRAALVFDGDMVQGTFEDHNIVNKYNAIVMNPPFGSGGKTAVDHLAKAAKHLKDGGRIVAIIPTGPAADKKFDKWLYEEDVQPVEPVGKINGQDVWSGDTIEFKPMAHPVLLSGKAQVTGIIGNTVHVKNSKGNSAVQDFSINHIEPTGKREKRATNDMQITASYLLPSVTFERAGTKVMARVVVLDKNGTMPQTERDWTDETTIKGFFDRIQDAAVPDRTVPESEATETTTVSGQPLPSTPKVEGVVSAQFEHTKTGAPIYVATVQRKLSDADYKAALALAKKNEGHYSGFKGAGAIPGFHFGTAENRDVFVRALGDKPDTSGLNTFFTLAKPLPDQVTLSPEAVNRVRAIIAQALPAGKVSVNIVPTIKYMAQDAASAYAAHGVTTSKIAGVHQSQANLTTGEVRSIITLAMDGATDRTGYHEVEHAAESLGILSAKDIIILERQYPGKDGVSSSERRADAFGDYVAGKSAPKGYARTLFDRIKAFIRKVKGLLTGQGWRTADDVFNDLMSGKLKRNAQGVAVPAAGSTGKFSLADQDKFTSTSPEVQRRRDAAHGLDKGPGLLDRLKETIDRAMKETQHFPELDMKKDAQTADILRVFEASRQAATAKTVAYLKQLTGKLNAKEMDAFEWRVLLDDLTEEASKGRDLPFGYTPETLAVDHSRIIEMTEGNENIKEAIEKRQAEQQRIVKELVTAGLLPESVMESKNYFRHMVLEYANAKKWAGLGTKELRNKKRGWQKSRQGSELDINTNFLEAEFEVYSQQLKELATKDTLDKVEKINNIAPKLKKQAKADNFENLVGGPDVVKRIRQLESEAREIRDSDEVDSTDKQRLVEIAEELDGLDPTRPFKRSMAIGFSKLEKLAKNGQLPEGKGRLKGIAESLANGEPTEKLFNYLAALSAGADDAAGTLPARQVLSAVAKLDKLYRDKLGNEYLEYRAFVDRRLIPDGYTEWQPEKGNVFHRETTLPERIVDRAIAATWSVDELIQSGLLRESLVVAGKKRTLIFPEGVAKTLDNLRLERDTAVLDNINKKVIGAWKIWTLLSPRRVIKYNLNNMSGDLDAALAADPKILGHLKAAWQGAMARRKGSLSAMDKDMLDRGVLDSGISINEIPDINQLPFFKDLTEAQRQHRLWLAISKGDLSALAPTSLITKYFDKISTLTNVREGLLREAAYRRALDLLQQGRPVIWASNKAEIDAIPDQKDKAAKLARELIGDYGNISAHGERIRARYLPFWSWMEINAPRYYRIFRNAGQNGGKYSTGARIAGVAGKKFIGTTAGVVEKLVLTQILFALATAFNHLVHGDDDDDLNQKQLHLIMGKDSAGRIMSVRFQGAFSDALSWFGLEDYPETIKKMRDGSMDAWDLGRKMALATPNKLVNAALPFVKLAGETITGKTIYPDATKPRAIRDRGEHLSRFLSLDNEYRAAAGKPSRGYADSLKGILFYTSDPREQAYNDIRGEAMKWMEKQGKEMPGGEPTAKSNTLYYFKQAQRFGDADAAKKYLQKYQELGGTAKGLETSIRNASPVAATGKYTPAFVQSLSPAEQMKLKLAMEFYNEVYGK